MVTTVLPAAALSGREQERVWTPSTWTVQAPQAAMPQPNFGPTMFRSSRRTQSSGLSAGASTSRFWPLTIRAIIAR
jgi:hypothetical protein